MKLHTCLEEDGLVPEVFAISDAAACDRAFLGQLPGLGEGSIVVMDKGYTNYKKFAEWDEQGIYFVIPMQNNARYEVLADNTANLRNDTGRGITKDLRVCFNHHPDKPLVARLLEIQEPEEGQHYWLVSNLHDFQSHSIRRLYHNRWRIEVVFKQLKQNFQLSYFYSDSKEGIKTQVWIALIANLLITIIHRMTKEKESFTVIRSMLALHMGSFMNLMKVIGMDRVKGKERDIKKIQMCLFDSS